MLHSCVVCVACPLFRRMGSVINNRFNLYKWHTKLTRHAHTFRNSFAAKLASTGVLKLCGSGGDYFPVGLSTAQQSNTFDSAYEWKIVFLKTGCNCRKNLSVCAAYVRQRWFRRACDISNVQWLIFRRDSVLWNFVRFDSFGKTAVDAAIHKKPRKTEIRITVTFVKFLWAGRRNDRQSGRPADPTTVQITVWRTVKLALEFRIHTFMYIICHDPSELTVSLL